MILIQRRSCLKLKNIIIVFFSVIFFWKKLKALVVKKTGQHAFPKFSQDNIKEAVKLKLIANNIDWRIEPHPYHPRDFAVEEDPFAWEIKRTGQKIKT